LKKFNLLLLSFYYTPDYCAGSFRAKSISDALLREQSVNHLYIYTTQPHRYGGMENFRTENKQSKSTVVKFKIPQHNNVFFRQVYSFLIYAIKSFVFSIKNRKQIDLILITSSRFGTSFLGFITSKVLKKPLAIDIRDIFSDNLNSFNNSNSFLIKFLIKIIKKIEIIIIRHAKWKNFVSPGFLEYYDPGSFNMDHMKIYTNGIDEIFVDNRILQNSNIKNNYNNSAKIINILYAGNIGYGQALEKILIPLAKFFREKIVFEVIGDGNSKIKLINQIEKFNIHNIKLYDPISRNKLLNYYNKTDCLLLHLNDIKAFERVIPSKIFEYATFEKPVLAGLSGTARRFIEKNLNGFYLFPPNDLDFAKTQMNKILSDIHDKKINNSKFIHKYQRSVLMKKMAKDIVKSMESV
jgi:hypothetical protein